MPVRALAAILVISTVGWPPLGPAPGVIAVYPNPVLPEDTGEFVVLDVPHGTVLSDYVLADGEDAIRLPEIALDGTVAIAVNDTPARLVGYPVVEVESLPALSNAGERLELRRASDGRVVDVLAYPDASEAEVWTDAGSYPLGATDHEPVTVEDVQVTAFVLPDDPAPVFRALRTADDRILLAGYTFTSKRVRAILQSAERRGVDVHVLLEESPVGGDSPDRVAALDNLTRAGVAVRLLGGPRSRYAFHHAKYAIADDAAIVMTENWGATGVGGHSNRGWGIVVHDARFAAELAAIYRSDAGWVDARPWPTVREPASGDAETRTNATYPTRFRSRRFTAGSVTLAVTPDNAARVVVGFVENATGTLRVQQVRLGDGRLSRSLIRAAARGVDVEILLSGRWYVRDENEQLARCLNGYTQRAGIPLTVRVVEPRSRFGKVHAKVAVAGGERVLLGSLNWNEYALTRNREVLVVVEGRDVARYYGRVFRADWRGGAWRIPAGVLGVAIILVISVALGFARRLQFETERGVRPGTPVDAIPMMTSPERSDGRRPEQMEVRR